MTLNSSPAASSPPSVTHMTRAKAFDTRSTPLRQLGANPTVSRGEAAQASAMHHAEKPLSVRLQVAKRKYQSHVSVPQCPRWSKCSVAIFDQVLQVDLCTFMCHAESHIVSSTSYWCSFECSRKLWEARVWKSPQLVGWGRVRTCDRRCGWSLWKQGAGHSAPSRRAWFDCALRRVHMATRRIRINGCVLPRRKRRPRPRTPVHKGPLRLPRRRPRFALPGMARGSARGEASNLGRLRRGRPHTKRQARRRKGRARGRAKRTNSSGRARGSAFLCFLRSTLWQSQPESWKKVFWAPFQEDSISGLEPKVQRLAQ